jgi:hypothetical protein
MPLDPHKLEKHVKLTEGISRARCPACAAAGQDSKGEHLRIYPDGRFGCCLHPGDTDHRKHIWALAGDHRQHGIILHFNAAPARPAVKTGILRRIPTTFPAPGTAGTPFGYTKPGTAGTGGSKSVPGTAGTGLTALETPGTPGTANGDSKLFVDVSDMFNKPDLGTAGTPLNPIREERHNTYTCTHIRIESATPVPNVPEQKTGKKLPGCINTPKIAPHAETADNELPFIASDGRLPWWRH